MHEWDFFNIIKTLQNSTIWVNILGNLTLYQDPI